MQALQEDEYARHLIAPAGGIKHSTFFDTVNERGVEQLFYVFTQLQQQAAAVLPIEHIELGDLVVIDGSLIDSVLSMHWAEYRTNSRKAKLHLGFNLNHGIPGKLFLTEGKGAERLRSDPQAMQEAMLGGRIFKDVNLSKNANQSCMTCHHPSAGFADPVNKIYPTEFPVSEGSIPGLFGGRNAPSAAYAGFSPNFYYDAGEQLYIGGMFWDGRATGSTLNDPLTEQALGPFLNPVEMAPSKEKVIKIIKRSDYADLFERVFGAGAFDNVNEATITSAGLSPLLSAAEC